MPTFTVQQSAATAQCFTEPLEGLGEAISLDMVLIKGGSFWMGSPDDEPESTKAEGPQREVTVPTFFMGRYPVTQAQWKVVSELPRVDRALESDPSSFKGDDRPVERVSWYEAMEFCQRLTQHSGRPYLLPTEAEWEYACRAGTKTPFSFGQMITPEAANYNGNYAYDGGPKGEYRKETTSVNHFGIANAWGLCDMHGNVCEWCEDHWYNSYRDTPVDGRAWKTNDDDAVHIIRGGSWSNSPRDCRSAFRSYSDPDDRSYGIGFRVVCRAP
ncbi:MAG: formylglycine-generating enzyme family protein [Cyanobacteria bacterium P01_C01_bin.121]